MRKGVIVLVPFPFTDLSGQKVRPALVLYAGKGEDCIVAFITTHPKGKKLSYAIPLNPSPGNGLKVSSVVRVDKLATLQKKVVLGEIGEIEPEILGEVDLSLKKMLAIG